MRKFTAGPNYFTLISSLNNAETIIEIMINNKNIDLTFIFTHNKGGGRGGGVINILIYLTFNLT